ncbi:phage tail sheath C-terminal domain-containing protein [Megamonas funiformis]|uniref:phage tail sheath C-terminal domain-containing protein n=1 Tax=Megamonas funiformis TaxID=437897 RepID=UPI00265D3391|nr:phage tail sheath C-terminal domain-containing protein [Megamonas funiformis]
MANEKEIFGMPKVLITFKTKSTTAIARSARGIVAMILKNETTDVMKSYKISDITDIPDKGLTDKNVDLIKKCLLGTPLRILVYTIPDDTVAEPTVNQSYVLKQISNIKWNYICAPTASGSEQEDLDSWIKTQRSNKYKTFKAVLANMAADDKGIINFCTGDIKVPNPDYVEDATETPAEIIGESIVGDSTVANDDTVKPYTIYTATEYTARIAGILAGLSLDRSATYYQLPEVESVETYEDIDSLIDKGQLLLVDEGDGDGVKIARACNSLTTFTTDVGQDFRSIKIVECIDMITDDIRDTFKSDYVGKVINDYNHKMLFISAILVYFSGLKGNVLDNSPTAQNTVDIDEEQQKNYAILKGEDVAEMTVQQIREYNTGTNVYLTGRITPVNAMEDLTIDFTM